MSYPDVLDVQAYLEETGLSVSTTRLGSALSSAISLWEQGTGFVPFVAGEEDTERLFTLSRPWYEQAIRTGWFDLKAGLVPSEAITVAIEGTELTLGTQWRPGPESAKYSQEPYTLIRFLSPQMCEYEALSITGRWGYCLPGNLPGEVFDAICQKAASILGLPLVAAASTSAPTGPLVSIKEGDVERKWQSDKDPLTVKSLLTHWSDDFEATMVSYKLAGVV